MNDEAPPPTTAAATAAVPPPKGARQKRAKLVGEAVEVRLGPGLWTTMPKPRSRRGKRYVEHLREVLAEFEQRGIPATKGNLRRVAAGRGPRLRAALLQILKKK
jgi:hypothetical protein